MCYVNAVNAVTPSLRRMSVPSVWPALEQIRLGCQMRRRRKMRAATSLDKLCPVQLQRVVARRRSWEREAADRHMSSKPLTLDGTLDQMWIPSSQLINVD